MVSQVQHSLTADDFARRVSFIEQTLLWNLLYALALSTRCAMANDPRKYYPHRQNLDGSIDSICPRCFATVATAMDVRELHSYDKAHVCDATAIAHRSESNRVSRNLPSQAAISAISSEM
jgi:hypothetical protein